MDLMVNEWINIESLLLGQFLCEIFTCKPHIKTAIIVDRSVVNIMCKYR